MNASFAFRALLGSSALVLSTTAFAQVAQNQFDGLWNARISCPSNTEETGAKGYSYDFPTRVEDGVLSGSHGEEGTAGSLHIEGRISPDGNAELRANGRTGNPNYAVKKPSSGTPYSYRIRAHFEPTHGAGTRLEARVCNFTFTRQ